MALYQCISLSRRHGLAVQHDLMHFGQGVMKRLAEAERLGQRGGKTIEDAQLELILDTQKILVGESR